MDPWPFEGYDPTALAPSLASPSRRWVDCAELDATQPLQRLRAEGLDRLSTSVLILIAWISLALIFSFLCSIAEAVLLSITPSYIEGQREQHPQRACLLVRLRQTEVERSLAAILTLNTIAHTVGAIVSGSQAAIVFGNEWIGLFSAAMTLAILFFSEIVPKTIGAVYWRQLAMATAWFVRALVLLLYPLVRVSEALTKMFTRGQDVHVFSRDDFLALADLGERSGHIDSDESRILRNLFEFGSLRAVDVMTPRTVIVAFAQDTPIARALDDASQVPFSRLPVFDENLDQVTGFVLKDDMLQKVSEGRGGDALESLRRDIVAVPASLPLPALLERLLRERRHIAIVIDEFGGTHGLVTLEDVVETLLGMEIVDEKDRVDDMQALARRQWEQRSRSLRLRGRDSSSE